MAGARSRAAGVRQDLPTVLCGRKRQLMVGVLDLLRAITMFSGFPRGLGYDGRFASFRPPCGSA